MRDPEEVLDMPFISDDHATKLLQPGVFVTRGAPAFFLRITSEFRMGLRRTHCHENEAQSAVYDSSRRGTVKVVATLDEVRPFPSLIWNARFGPICVAPPIPVGRVVARDGV